MDEDSKFRKFFTWLPHHIQLILAAALLIFGIFVLADGLVSHCVEKYWDLAVAILFIILAGGVFYIADHLPINNISIHRYYRDRLMETFLPDVEKIIANGPAVEAFKANGTPLSSLNNPDNKNVKLPYPLINTNVVLIESDIAKFCGRGGDSFILSPLYCGSNATGWRGTKEFCGDKMTLPSAVAISGAAANPNAGVGGQGITTNPITSILMSIFNLRLGYWVSNPDPDCQPDQSRLPTYAYPGFWEVLFRKKMNEKAGFVQLSDGGHFENLGLYELLRHRARLIIVCDPGADKDYLFEDLANAIEKARVDFGVRIDLDVEKLRGLVPASQPSQIAWDYPLAKSGHKQAKISYPNDESGTLVYIKTTLPAYISADIHGYKRANSGFPDQTTMDQFFDEV